MNNSIEFILTRAQASRAAQNEVAAVWLWEEKTVAAWDTDIDGLITQQEATADAEAQMEAKRGELDAKLDELHTKTMQGLNIAKTKYRNNPAKLPVIKNLSAKANSRTGTLQEALDWESAWEKLDAAWLPLTGLTLASFKTLRTGCITLQEQYANERAAWRSDAEQLNELAAVLDDVNVGWYNAATHVFPEGTSEGDMIRGTVPTTYEPLEFPSKAVITLAESPETGVASITYESDHATTFDVFHKGPGEAVFAKILSDVAETQFTSDLLPLGNHDFKVVGKNSRGDGPESDVSTVAVG